MSHFDEMASEEQMSHIHDQLQAISHEIAFIKECMIKADTTIASIAEQVMPTINELTQSPMLSMFLGKKKK